MVFNLCIGFQDLTTKATKGTDGVARPYSVLIADTLVVTAEEPESLTRLPREFKDVSYTLGAEDDEQAGGMDNETEAAVAAAAAADRRTTRGVGKDALRVDMAAEESEQKRAAHQKELAKRKQEEALRRYAAGSMEDTGSAASSFDLSQLHAYKSVNDLPSGRVNHVTVDTSNDCVLFPINDQLVPFHISTILRVYKRDENGFTCQCAGEAFRRLRCCFSFGAAAAHSLLIVFCCFSFPQSSTSRWLCPTLPHRAPR